MLPELDASQIQQTQIHQAEIQQIIQSKAFKTSEVHRNLLIYLAEKSLAGTAHNLKEYTIGLDVFGKPSSFDPRQESVVRMHVGRLRQKLAEYYRTEGQQDQVIVDLPKGAFSLTFSSRPAAPVEGDAPAPPPAARSFSLREGVLALALLLAVVCAAYFGFRLSTAQQRPVVASTAAWTADLQQLWGPLLSSDRPLMVTLATDPFHASNIAGSSGVTGVGTANAAFLLGQFLGQRKHNVFPIRSDLLSMGEIAMGDVIFVGPTLGKPQIQAIPPVDQPFVLTADGIRNVKPLKGEPAFLTDGVGKGSQDFEESYALVSHLPGLYGNGEILYLAGNQVASVMGAVQALTDPDLARNLVSHLKNANGAIPRYYQVVLKVRATDDTPVDISYLFHRELAFSRSAVAERR